jgi:hypothetical protein
MVIVTVVAGREITTACGDSIHLGPLATVYDGSFTLDRLRHRL